MHPGLRRDSRIAALAIGFGIAAFLPSVPAVLVGELDVWRVLATLLGLAGAALVWSAARLVPATFAEERNSTQLREGGRILLGAALWVGGMALTFLS